MTDGEALARRVALAGGLLHAAAVGVWWLGSTRAGLLGGADTSRIAAQALLALVLLRGLWLALTALRDGARRGTRAAVSVALLGLAPAWPLGVLAWSASAVPLAAALAAEAALLLAALLLPAAGTALARAWPAEGRAEPVALALGVLLAAGVWHWRALVEAFLRSG